MGEENNSSATHEMDKQATKEAAKTAANAYAGPVGGGAVELLSKTKIGNELLERGTEALKKTKQKILLSLILFMLPFFLIVFVILIAVFYVTGIFNGSGGLNGNVAYDAECNYENTQVVVMDGNKEQVLATISLEDYIIGVLCPEIGACDGSVSKMNEEYLKAHMVVSKTYILVRGGYKSATKSITARAATKDQQWCDLKVGCVSTVTSHRVPGTSSYYHYTYPANWPRDKIDGRIKGKRYFTDEDLELLHKYYQETYGDLFLPNDFTGPVEKLTYAQELSYLDHTQTLWNNLAKQGKNYEEILKATATSGDSKASFYKNKSIYKLGSYCKATYLGGSGNLVDLGEYPTDHKNVKQLQTNIKTALGESRVTQLENYIKTNVSKAGYGTGAGVAAAGQSLAYGLYQNGYYLGYCWGGDRHSVGIGNSWGNRSSGCNSPYNSHRYYGMDCSGFVSWSIRNGCNSGYGARTANGYKNLSGTKGISLRNAKPGDLMASSKHVRLIVKNNGDGSVITAESGGSKDGLYFHKYSSAGGYKIVDMSSWYAKNCKSSG